MTVSIFSGVWLGIRRHRFDLISSFLEFFGAAWLLIETTSYFSPAVRQFAEGNIALFFGVLFAAGIGTLAKAWEPTAVSICLPTTDTKVTIKFGDLFEDQSNHIVIPVNDGFDGELGQTVSPKSLHGQFIQRFYQGNQREFEKARDALLPKPQANSSGRSGRKLAYPIGTTIGLPLAGRNAFLFALANTDPDTRKARSDVSKMWAAMMKLWSNVRYTANGHSVSLPLVGGGLSGVGLEPKRLLQLILLSILVSTREAEVSKNFNIVLHPSLFDSVDLRALQTDWS